MKEFTIGEVARYAGVETSAIRYYEREGLLPIPKRVNGHRRYDPSVLKRLILVQLLRQASFGIREIQALFGRLNEDTETVTQWQTVAAAKITELDTLIEQTQVTRTWLAEALESHCDGVDDCIAVAFDERENKMDITLSCIDLTSSSGPDHKKTFKLITMSSLPNHE